MTKLFKSAFDVDDLSFKVNKFHGYVSQADAKRIISLPESISEDGLVEQRDLIEKCASSKSKYFYSSKWNGETVGQIREYACMCGCEIEEVDPDNEKIQEMAKQEMMVIKEASVATVKDVGIRDPFERNIDLSYMDKRDWQAASPSVKVSKPTALMTSSNIISIGGGEDTGLNPHLNVRRGQNSVTDPNSIGKTIENKRQDVGARLREEAKNRQESRKSEIKAQEKLMVQEAEGKGYGSLASGGKVVVTEALNAQPGIRGEGAFNFNVPEQTMGEKIREQNTSRKESIQREENNETREWDKPQGASRHVIADDFTKALKKNLEKITKK